MKGLADGAHGGSRLSAGLGRATRVFQLQDRKRIEHAFVVDLIGKARNRWMAWPCRFMEHITQILRELGFLDEVRNSYIRGRSLAIIAQSEHSPLIAVSLDGQERSENVELDWRRHQAA